MVQRVAVGILTLVSGCSFFATTVPRGQTERCITSSGALTADGAAVAVAAVADAWFLAAQSRGCGTTGGDDPCLGEGVLAAGLTVLALPSLAGAIYGFSHKSCPKPGEELKRVADVALHAARTGDCVTVAELDAQVSELDPSFHDARFVHDSAVARCLQGRFLAACLRQGHPPMAAGTALDIGAAALAVFSPPAWNATAPTTACPTDRETAMGFTGMAAAAARAGDCTMASHVAPLIRAIDPPVHEVFAHDASIARCLGAPSHRTE